MREARFYVPREGISGGHATVKGEQARHIVSVLRKKPGDPIVLFDGQGTQYAARIVRIDHDFVVAEVEGKEVREGTSRPAIGLYVALPKGRKFDLIVDKATELGADSITPLVTERTVVKPDDRGVSAKLQRWRRVSVAAAKQCGRSTLPRISEPVGFLTAMKDLPESVFAILARSVGDSPPIGDVLRDVGPVHEEIRAYVGPEGGLSEEEARMAADAGVRFASLGDNVLRTETAAITCVAVIACFLDQKLTASAPVVRPGE